MGLVQYGESSVHEWSLGDFRTKEEVVRAARNLSRREGRETKTAQAIMMAWWDTGEFGRPEGLREVWSAVCTFWHVLLAYVCLHANGRWGESKLPIICIPHCLSTKCLSLSLHVSALCLQMEFCLYTSIPPFLKKDLFVICLFINWLIDFWLLWVFVATCRLSLVAASRRYSSLQCMGFSLWLLLLWSTDSRALGLR